MSDKPAASKSPTSVKALREKLREPTASIQTLRDTLHARNEGKPTVEWQDFSAEEKSAWDKANTEYNAIAQQISYAEAAERVDAAATAVSNDPLVGRSPLTPAHLQNGGDGSEAAITDEQRAIAFAGWCSVQMRGAATDEQMEACRKVGLNPACKEIEMPMYRTQDYRKLQRQFRSVHPTQTLDRTADFHATLTSGSGPGGGYLIPPETMIRQLEINMLAYGGVRQVADTIRTATGEPLSWPTADDTTNTGVQLGESTTIGSSVDPTFGKVIWNAYKFSSKAVLVPYELIQDSAFDLPSILGQMLGERLGRITNTKFTTGSGGATPKGIVTAATSFSAASASAIAADDLIKLVHSVDPAYRNGAAFMMHDSILLQIRLLKDGNGQYLWQNGLQQGRPDQLLSFGLTINQDMDSTMSSGKKTVLYGQLSRYKIRTVGTTRMYRLEERYRDTDQDGFVAFTREDGNLLTAGTAPIKYLAH